MNHTHNTRGMDAATSVFILERASLRRNMGDSAIISSRPLPCESRVIGGKTPDDRGYYAMVLGHQRGQPVLTVEATLLGLFDDVPYAAGP